MQILKNDTKKKEDEESNNDSYKHDFEASNIDQSYVEEKSEVSEVQKNKKRVHTESSFSALVVNN